VLVTVTLGRNDLLAAYRAGGDRSGIFREMKKLHNRFDEVIRSLKVKLGKSTIVVTTVYDPTDGTGIMPTSAGYRGKMPIEYLTQFNDFVRQTADAYNLLVADVYAHFRGHGAECGSADEFWYFKASPIEPSYRGATEIRRVWMETIEPAL
jgi:lysophospholipase L1-like esterase